MAITQEQRPRCGITSWSEKYPRLAEAVRASGQIGDKVRTVAASLDADFDEGAVHVARYLGRLANSRRAMIGEEHLLVMHLALEACIINALQPDAIAPKRASVETDLWAVLKPNSRWLVEDLATEPYASLRQQWPFSVLDANLRT